MLLMKLSAAALAAAASIALAQEPTQRPAAAGPTPSIKLTNGYNPLDAQTDTVTVRVPNECEVIQYMNGTEVLRVGQVYVELRGVRFESRPACARRAVLRNPKTTGDDKAVVPSNFDTCSHMLRSLQTCYSDKDTCCTPPRKNSVQNSLVNDISRFVP